MRKYNCSKKQLVLVVSIIITTIVTTTHYVVKYRKNGIDDVRVVSKMDDYSYFLEDNQSNIYIENYRELKKILLNETINEEKYVSIISKLFIIDFYTLENKITNQDIGGLQFIHSEILDNFKLKAKNTIYKYLENNIYKNRNQELPSVKNVNIEEIKNSNQKFMGKEYQNGYEVTLSIEYEKDLNYAKKVVIYLIPEENKFSIIKIVEK